MAKSGRNASRRRSGRSLFPPVILSSDRAVLLCRSEARMLACIYTSSSESSMSREQNVPLLLWISTAILAHIAMGGGAEQIARIIEDRSDLHYFAREIMTRLQPPPIEISFENEPPVAPDEAKPEHPARPHRSARSAKKSRRKKSPSAPRKSRRRRRSKSPSWRRPLRRSLLLRR